MQCNNAITSATMQIPHQHCKHISNNTSTSSTLKTLSNTEITSATLQAHQQQCKYLINTANAMQQSNTQQQWRHELNVYLSRSQDLVINLTSDICPHLSAGNAVTSDMSQLSLHICRSSSDIQHRTSDFQGIFLHLAFVQTSQHALC